MQSSFPITFKNGFKVGALGFWCRQCGVVAAQESIACSVSRMNERVADLRASFTCACGQVSEYFIRFKDDGSYEYMQDGAWHAERARLSLVRKLYLRLVHSCMGLLLYWNCLKIMKDLKKTRNLAAQLAPAAKGSALLSYFKNRQETTHGQ